ncbi:phosphonate ABC transporter substrate-binding protein [Sulfitobacter guttiformis]|uniref:Phosphonate transport system substrate-binding protein n=1 Tax=Sulfitobacter guttiformis TaxID=74349 RepID=A0A420DT44_9RHOB|nr:phosphonate ABC transporter substrate-binding protein [Sulfitobacter guttiformis]KIN71010.1 Phosphonate ABC transporter, periplasmic phosphonate binding protein [Sulfitobacter guttiformis KCTC 32187]RKE97494.1 phosphonate transport system substrate-binding protein [Sulfitobacter guttiformis]
MKKLIALALATTAITGTAFAQDTAITEFRIGILGGENAQDRMNSNECLRSSIEEALGVPTKIFAPADYNGVIQGLLGGSIDLSLMGPSSYAAVHIADESAVSPILVKVNSDGSTGYYSIGFARIDSGVTSLEGLKGKVFGFGDPNSTSGYLIPSIEIPQITGASMDNGDYFGEVKFTGGHEQTIVAVNNGDVAAGVTWADGQGNWEDGYNFGALRKAVDAGLVDMNDLVEIWRSKLIPGEPVVLRNALPDDVRATVTQIIDTMGENDPACAEAIAGGEVSGFDPITHDAYTSIVAARLAESN